MSDPTLGALQISTGISGFLLGCLVLQTYMYFTNYPRDSVWIKSLVVLIFALEFALHVSLTELSYNISIINAGNIFVLFHLPTWPISPFISIFAMPITEIFYLWRIYRLLNKMWPSLVGTAISLFRTSCWIYYFSRAVRIGLPALAVDTERRWLVILLLSLAFFLNVSIVLVMTIYLARHRHTTAAKCDEEISRSTDHVDYLDWYDCNGPPRHVLGFVLDNEKHFGLDVSYTNFHEGLRKLSHIDAEHQTAAHRCPPPSPHFQEGGRGRRIYGESAFSHPSFGAYVRAYTRIDSYF
ncbi:hypothetical protein PLEOSDRAFT_1112445 [Pleurotus ostreatus PC15]|uniref:Uncharacterized protein n=1 Tax=Pleurotus ostreatus (strain PC15) TaxID=1137138 RepID=A0A067NPJ1_PLEO1|nr:hypothetical protein PLEOSDRAFT_1112445 [Pleurotus ostreatus PC15]